MTVNQLIRKSVTTRISIKQSHPNSSLLSFPEIFVSSQIEETTMKFLVFICVCIFATSVNALVKQSSSSQSKERQRSGWMSSAETNNIRLENLPHSAQEIAQFLKTARQAVPQLVEQKEAVRRRGEALFEKHMSNPQYRMVAYSLVEQPKEKVEHAINEMVRLGCVKEHVKITLTFSGGGG